MTARQLVQVGAQVVVDGVEAVDADEFGPLLLGLAPQLVGEPQVSLPSVGQPQDLRASVGGVRVALEVAPVDEFGDGLGCGLFGHAEVGRQVDRRGPRRQCGSRPGEVPLMLAMAFRAMSDHLHPTRPSPPPGSRRAPRLLRSFGRFWYDFVIGDDWKIAAAVAAGARAPASGTRAAPVRGHRLALHGGVLIMAGFSVGLALETRRSKP